jgi:hypothetical protein
MCLMEHTSRGRWCKVAAVGIGQVLRNIESEIIEA